MPAKVGGVSKESSDNVRGGPGPEIPTARWHWPLREHLVHQLEVAQPMDLQKLQIKLQHQRDVEPNTNPSPMSVHRGGAGFSQQTL